MLAKTSISSLSGKAGKSVGMEFSWIWLARESSARILSLSAVALVRFSI